MAEWSKALRSGRSPLLWAWVRIPLLTKLFCLCPANKYRVVNIVDLITLDNSFQDFDSHDPKLKCNLQFLKDKKIIRFYRDLNSDRRIQSPEC